MHLALVVEGDGEVDSLPLLLRRWTGARGGNLPITFSRPLNALGRGNLLKEDGIERFTALAAKLPGAQGILVLLDAEAPCGSPLARGLAQRVRATEVAVPVAIVAAVPMYEAWLVASASALAGRAIKGRPALPATVTSLPAAESLPNPKRWIVDRLPRSRGYHEPQDQPAVTAWIDLGVVAASCRSFRRLEHALMELSSPASRASRGFVTPA